MPCANSPAHHREWRLKTVVLVSPHAPLDARAFVAYREPQLYGDFANFRAPGATVEAPLDEELLRAISQEAAREDYQVVGIHGYDLDHGTACPSISAAQRLARAGRRPRLQLPL